MAIDPDLIVDGRFTIDFIVGAICSEIVSRRANRKTHSLR